VEIELSTSTVSKCGTRRVRFGPNSPGKLAQVLRLLRGISDIMVSLDAFVRKMETLAPSPPRIIT
jgi:hypothetical protein